jgi:serine/threonine-protein kinase
MAGDNNSFWNSYRRRQKRLQASEAVSRSRDLISRFPRHGPSRFTRRMATLDDTSLLPFPVDSSSVALGSFPVVETPDLQLTSSAGGPNCRYEVKDIELGRGGMGKVVVAYDRVLQRHVALKTPLPEVASDQDILAAFMAEVRLTAQLEHPNIIPIYDLVRSAEGSYGFAMRRVDGERLSDVLKGLQRGDPALTEAYGRVRLLTIFSQVVTAVAYAHDLKVIHRDLKPNNVMIGSYGEVLLLDWGLARKLFSPMSYHGLGIQSSSGFVGAPAYIAPEQLEGDDSRINELSDIYGLGAILYEILTYTPPYVRHHDEDEDEFLARIRVDTVKPPSVRAPERRIPPALEEICLKCLARDPADRYQAAMDIHRDVAMFLEGTKEQEWRRKAAEAHTREAMEAALRYEQLSKEAARCQQEAHAAKLLVNPWDPVERKREGWNLQQLAAQTEEAAMAAFSEAEKAYHQALGHDHDYRPATEGVTDLYWRRFTQAEASRNLSEMRYFEARVRTFDEGRYAIRLKGDGWLILETEPAGADVTVYSFREVDRVLRPVNPRDLGISPIKTTLSVGSYLVKIRAKGYREVLFPVMMSRLETIEARVRLYTGEELGPDFVYIPAGPFRAAGDPEAFSPEMQIRWLEDFAIGRLQVTAGQYLEFLNDLLTLDPEEARRRVPRLNESPNPLWPKGPDGRYHIPTEPDNEGHLWLPDFPIFCISWEDAVAYAAWRGARDGRAYRLPTGDEWEKAARGVDGRVFPWGDWFDATFCKNRDSHPGRPYPEAVGQYPLDCSPYGVQDMAGGASDWTLDSFGASRELRLVCGGSWVVAERACRPARKTGFRQEGVNISIGFRLCFSLSGRR